MRYFEDFHVGDVVELGSKEMKRDEMIAFAREYDPQPIHLADEGSPYGGVIASGWLTVAAGCRLLVDNLVAGAAGMGSTGFEELRWLAPVRPGDTISYRVTVLEATPSQSNAERGTVRWLFEGTNQNGVDVLRMDGRMFFRRKPQPDAA